MDGHRTILRPCVLFLLLASSAAARDAKISDIEHKLKKAFIGNQLTFRTPNSADKIAFDEDGRCLTNCNSGGWAGDGTLLIKHVRLDSHSLRLSGEHVIVFFDINGQRRELPGANVAVNIALHSPPTEQSVARSLVAIFRSQADKDPDAAPPGDTPDGYACKKDELNKRFCRKQGSNAEWESQSLISEPLQVGVGADGEKIYVISKAVQRPLPVYTPDPEYTEAARRAKRQGSARLAVVVDKIGRIQSVGVLQQSDPDFGLVSAKALATWKFKPATMNGQDVAVRIEVETNFRIY